MTDLTYPVFPRRALVAIGAALFALCVVAIVINRSGPDMRKCAAAAEHVMAARNYSIDAMTRIGSNRVPACHGLTAGQYGEAVANAYLIEYGAAADTSISRDIPPASFRARSALAASQRR